MKKRKRKKKMKKGNEEQKLNGKNNNKKGKNKENEHKGGSTHTIIDKKRITQKRIENTQKIRRGTNPEDAKEAHCITLFNTIVRKRARTYRYPLIYSFHLISSLSFFLFSFFFLQSSSLPFSYFFFVYSLIRFNSSVNHWPLMRLLEIFPFFGKYLLSICFYILIKEKIKNKNKIKIAINTTCSHIQFLFHFGPAPFISKNNCT